MLLKRLHSAHRGLLKKTAVCNFIKETHRLKCFHVNFVKPSRKTLLTEHFWNSFFKVWNKETRKTSMDTYPSTFWRDILKCGKVKHELRDTTCELRVTSSNPRTTSSNLQVTSSNPQVRGLKALVARLKGRVAKLKARFRSWSNVPVEAMRVKRENSEF